MQPNRTPRREPDEIHVFFDETFGKWNVVLRFRIPYRHGWADFMGESHYGFLYVIDDLTWMFGPMQDWSIRLKIKHPRRLFSVLDDIGESANAETA